MPIPERRAAATAGPTFEMSSVSGPVMAVRASSPPAAHWAVPKARALSSSWWSCRTNQRSLASVASQVPSMATRSARVSGVLRPVACIRSGAVRESRPSLTVPCSHAATVNGSWS